MNKHIILVVAAIVFITLLPCAVSQQRQHRRQPGEEDASTNFPHNDLFKFFSDVQKRIGLDGKSLERFSQYLTRMVYDGQVYTERNFQRDYAKVCLLFYSGVAWLC